MKIIFFGDYPISASVLKRIWNSSEVKVDLVVTKDGFEKNGQFAQTPVANFIKEQNKCDILFYSNDCRQVSLLERIKQLQPDILLSVSYSRLIPSEILKTPRKGAFNIHPSLLPRWRGPDPIRCAIFHDDEYTGVSVHEMTSNFDGGRVVFQEKTPINPQDTLEDLQERITHISENAALHLISTIKSNNLSLITQDESKATYAPHLIKSDNHVDFQTQPEKFYRLFRALYPYHFLTISVNGEMFIVKKCIFVETKPQSKEMLYVKTSNGYLCFVELISKQEG